VPRALFITVPGSHAVEAVSYEAAAAGPTLVLAHGAGAGQQGRFMVDFAKAMVERSITVVTFDFPYVTRGSRLPDRPRVLEETWRAVIAETSTTVPRGRTLVVGGKSMGGRIASQVLTAPIAAGRPDAAGDLRARVAGLLLLGYPLHPPKQPDRLRTGHLPALEVPVLVVQGERDEFGSEAEVRAAFSVVPGPVDWLIVPGGDHSLRTERRAGVDASLYDEVATWIHHRGDASYANMTAAAHARRGSHDAVTPGRGARRPVGGDT
jgi:uncharacterized protein